MRRTCPCEHRLSTHRAAQPTGGPLPEARGPGKGREEARRPFTPRAVDILQR